MELAQTRLRTVKRTIKNVVVEQEAIKMEKKSANTERCKEEIEKELSDAQRGAARRLEAQLRKRKKCFPRENRTKQVKARFSAQ